MLVCFHKQALKESQVKEFEDIEEKIPCSAKVKFNLQGSKLVEKDQEFISLCGETNLLVQEFRKTLKIQVVKGMTIEVKKLKQLTLETYATNLRMATKAILLCKVSNEKVDIDKFITTMFKVYKKELITLLGLTTTELTDTYKQIHTIQILPQPYVTQLPVPADANRNLPSKWLLDQFPKVHRLMEQIYVSPWEQYNNIVERNGISHKLHKLHEEFFSEKKAEDTAMEIDDEAPVDPKVMKQLINNEVDKSTKPLKKEIASLWNQLNNTSVKKPGTHPVPEKRKKAETTKLEVKPKVQSTAPPAIKLLQSRREGQGVHLRRRKEIRIQNHPNQILKLLENNTLFWILPRH